MSYINEMYAKNPVYSLRADKDEMFLLPRESVKFRGIFDNAIRFVSENHCKNKHNWILFAEQFKSNVDDEGHAWRIEYWGKMMRGAAFTYAYTGDRELYDMMEETVKDLLSTQDELGRITTYSLEQEFNGWDIWGRKYVLLGLQYFMDVCENDELKAQITDAMCRSLDYIISKVGDGEGKKPIAKTSAWWGGINSCSILEPVVRMYNLTGKKEYLDFADYIVSTGGIDEGNIFELAYEGKLYPYQYPVVKAYEMMSNFEGLMEYYRVTGIEKWRIAACNFGKLVAESDITIIGSSGCTHELFDNSVVKQTNTRIFHVMQETCVTVTWIKFITQVLLLCGDASLVDQLEKSIYNALLGSINTENSPNNGGVVFDSYSPLLGARRGKSMGGFQLMRNGTEFFGCCVAIGAAGTGHIPSVAVMAKRDGVVVNLYEKGEALLKTPQGNDLTLVFDTEYPLDGTISVKVNPEKPEKFSVNLRVPAWSKKRTLKINGQKVNVNTGYTQLCREWSKGDEIVLTLDMRVRIVDALDDADDCNAKYHKALVRGPIVLARDARLGEEVDGVVDFATKGGYAVVKPSDKANFYRNLEFAVKQKDGSYIHVVDYMSAGKTWDRNSLMTAWMPTKKYCSFDETKPVTLFQGYESRYLVSDKDGVVSTQKEAQKWQIERDGFYVMLKHIDSGKYLALSKKDDVISVCMKEKCDCDCVRWTMKKHVFNKYTFINKLYGMKLASDVFHGDMFLLNPFKTARELPNFDNDVSIEFVVEN